jgi:hypothetical protein
MKYTPFTQTLVFEAASAWTTLDFDAAIHKIEVAQGPADAELCCAGAPQELPTIVIQEDVLSARSSRFPVTFTITGTRTVKT